MKGEDRVSSSVVPKARSVAAPAAGVVVENVLIVTADVTACRLAATPSPLFHART